VFPPRRAAVPRPAAQQARRDFAAGDRLRWSSACIEATAIVIEAEARVELVADVERLVEVGAIDAEGTWSATLRLPARSLLFPLGALTLTPTVSKDQTRPS